MALLPSKPAGGPPPLVMRCGAMGDMVLLTVLLRQLQTRFGTPVDVISSGPWNLPLLGEHSAINRLFLIRSRRTPYWLSGDQRRLVSWLRGRGPGPTWFCDLGLGKELLSRAGIADDHVVDSRAFPWIPGESFADRYIRLGSQTPPALAGVVPPPSLPVARAAHLEITATARAELGDWLGRRGLAGRALLVVHPGSRHMARRRLRPRSGASKYWPEQRWGEVVRALRRLSPDHAILMSGTRGEYRLNADIVAQAGVPDVHNVADDLPIRTLLPLLERAQGMISVDTGPAHAAAALGCPTVALFGTADSQLFRPGGATTPAVALTGRVDGQQNILGISVAAVIDAWLGLPQRR